MGRKRKNASRPAGSPSSDDLGVNVAVRNSANERERDRMRVLSKAFTRLKTTLPWVPPDTKLSKLDTLRLASSYIAHLARMLAEDAENNDSSVRRHVADTGSAVVDGNAPSVHPRKLTWPYTFGSPVRGSDSSPETHPQHQQQRDPMKTPAKLEVTAGMC
ncbi:Transcription factor 21 [Lamellibrachia satsuma]|nr:Transcription factor 21 [Lamellibrachia satsuma]